MATRAEIIAEARTWLGTPYHHQGRVKGVGVDCIGVVGGTALNKGVDGAKEWANDPVLHCYGMTPDPRVLIGACDRLLVRIPLHTAMPGDVLVMAFEKEPQHFGIITQLAPMMLIHAYRSARRVVENGIGMSRVKLLRAYSFLGVTT